jgi:DNA-binding CsgD family transcriptional regulator
MKCKKHNFIVWRENLDWDICTECGYKRDTTRMRQRQGDIYSIDRLKENGIDIGDGGETVNSLNAHIDADLLLSPLTKKQKAIVQLMSSGYRQTEIAKMRGVGKQAISNIVSRIRKQNLQRSAV